MKSKRTPLLVNDFGGGLMTTAPQTDVDTDPREGVHTPDSLNVYAEGKALRKRFGTAHINSASAGTTGNGIYNWVINASTQYLVALFDTTLKKMSVSGSTWSGTWSTVSNDSANGTQFSNSLMYFVTYSGTLIMTTEARDKPQRITSSDTSYKNLDFSGVGVAPQAKYPQVWKGYVFLLNIGGGGLLTEECTTLSWTTLDVGTGQTSLQTFQGLTTFEFHAGTLANDNSEARKVVSGITYNYSVEMKTYFATLGAVTSGDYAWMDIYNGAIRYRTRWSTDGIEIYNGSSWGKVSSTAVSVGTWSTWKFFVTGGTASAAKVSVYQNNSAIGLQYSCALANAGSVGEIDLTSNAGGSANRADWYLDYYYLNQINAVTDYITDGGMEANYLVDDTSTKYLLQCQGPAGGTFFQDNSSFKKSTTFTGTISLSTAQVKFGISSLSPDGTSGYVTTPNHSDFDFGNGAFSIDLWWNPTSTTTKSPFCGKAVDNNNFYTFSFNTPNLLQFQGFFSSSYTSGIFVTIPFTPTIGSWHHLAITRDGSSNWNLYINGVAGTKSLTQGTYTNNFPALATTFNVCYGKEQTDTYASGYFSEVRVAKGTARNILATPPDNMYQSTKTIHSDTLIYPVQPFNHFKMNDNAASTVVTDNGVLATNGTANVNTSAITTAGKVGNAFSFTSASSHNININGMEAVVRNDAYGSLSMWIYPKATGGKLFTLSAAGSNSYYALSVGTNSLLHFEVANAGAIIYSGDMASTLTLNAWQHIALINSGSATNFYLNGANVTFTSATNTTPAAWFAHIGTLDTGRIGCISVNGAGSSGFYTGYIDDFRYYSHTISTTHLSAIYAEASGNEVNWVTVQEGTTFIEGTYSLRANSTSGTYNIASQLLVSGRNLESTPCIFGLWANITNNLTYKINVNDGFSDNFSPVITANGTWQYNTLTFTPTGSATSIRAQVITYGSGTVYLDQWSIVPAASQVPSDNSDTFQYSANGTYDTWSGGDSGSDTIRTPGDVGLTGSFILQDRMYITKAWSVYRITYTASIPLLDIKQAKNVVGTKSPRSIKTIDYPGYGELVIFLGTDRNIYLFDGFSSTPLNDNYQFNNNITQVYTDNINPAALNNVFAVNHSNISCYELFVPLGNSTTPNYSIFYNYKTKAAWGFDNRNYLSGDVSDDGNGERVIMVQGASNGIVYEINTDKHTDDDGSAINAYWTSFKLGEDYVLGKQDQIQIACDSVTATPTFQWRSNYETIYVTQTLKASTNQNVYDPMREANLIQFKVGDNSTGQIWKIWHIKTLERGIGIGG